MRQLSVDAWLGRTPTAVPTTHDAADGTTTSTKRLWTAATAVEENDGDEPSVHEEEDEEDYETQRLRRIEANNRMLAELGLASLKGKMEAVAPPPKKRATVPRSRPLLEAADLLRRSSPRLAGRATLQAAPAHHEESNDSTSKPDVAPLGHAVGRAAAECLPLAAATTRRAQAVLSGHRHHVYSASFTGDGALLAVAGSEGIMTLFSMASVSETPTRENEGQNEPLSIGPLAIIPGIHRRWIADVQFVSGQHDQLLTASDDGTLVLSRLAHDGQYSAVPTARLCTEIHRGGVFAMHEAFLDVATASKDGSVAVTRVDSNRSGLTAMRRFANAGTSVLKSVHWQESLGAAHVFACAGNDRIVRLFDMRDASSEPAMAFPDEHSMAINSVVFSPTENHHLLSAGFDASVRLWDLRLTRSSVFSGHHRPVGKPPLMHPIFDETGRYIFTGGNGTSCIFVYDTVTATNPPSPSTDDVRGPVRAVDIGTTPHTLALVPGRPGLVCASSGKTLIQLVECSFGNL